jgi:hypothetical protein
MTDLLVPVSAGELLDKIAILRIKAERIRPVQGRERQAGTFRARIRGRPGDPRQPRPDGARIDLKTVNEALWEIEDDIRERDAQGDFGPDFVRLAQAVYRTNDRRAAIKRDINRLTGSALVEEKSYHEHGASPDGH